MLPKRFLSQCCARIAPAALLAGFVIVVWNPGSVARAGCGVGAPTSLCAPEKMPSNGAISLVLTHPMWHSRRGATGPYESAAPLGTDAADLPFVLSRNGTPEPLRIQAKRDLPRGGVIVELLPAAGWSAGARYELQADVGAKGVYPAFAAVAAADVQPPTWGPQQPTATIIRPEVPQAERPPKSPHKQCETTGSGDTQKTVCTTTTYSDRILHTKSCVTQGTGKSRRTSCTEGGGIVAMGGGSSCPPRIEEAHVALKLPATTDDYGGAIMLEISAGATTTWVPAAREVALGLSSACTPANFPPPPKTPYELLITPVDAAQNRGVTLHLKVK